MNGLINNIKDEVAEGRKSIADDVESWLFEMLISAVIGRTWPHWWQQRLSTELNRLLERTWDVRRCDATGKRFASFRHVSLQDLVYSVDVSQISDRNQAQNNRV